MNTSLPRLLLVDDEPRVIDGISRRLRHHYEVHSANDGAGALRLLEERGQMHIIVSDMRMPNMNGAMLLSQVCKLYPDMVRILLTGHAELEAAIAAVNEGQIFRFLVKPCLADVLLQQLSAAVRQYELIVSERVLLDQTLRGAVQVLSEVLALAMPEAFGKATRVRQRGQKLAERLGLPDLWRIDVAATLSQVGAVTLGGETASKLYRAQPLTADEQAAVDRLPSIAVEMLKPIPRLEPVRELILTGFATKGASVPRTLEGQVLRICVEYDALFDSGVTGTHALAPLQARGFERSVLSALAELVADETSDVRIVEVSLEQLREGMVLTEDVYASSGTLLLARGNTVKSNVIERLRTMKPNFGNRQKLRVKLPD